MQSFIDGLDEQFIRDRVDDDAIDLQTIETGTI